MKCEKCGYLSFDHNYACPSCGKDLTMTRSRLGDYFDPPEVRLADFLADQSGSYQAVHSPVEHEAELDLDGMSEETELSLDADEEDFEFSLDD